MNKLIIPMLLTMLVMPAFSQEPSVTRLNRYRLQKALQGDAEAQANLGLRYEREKVFFRTMLKL